MNINVECEQLLEYRIGVNLFNILKVGSSVDPTSNPRIQPATFKKAMNVITHENITITIRKAFI